MREGLICVISLAAGGPIGGATKAKLGNTEIRTSCPTWSIKLMEFLKRILVAKAIPPFEKEPPRLPAPALPLEEGA